MQKTRRHLAPFMLLVLVALRTSAVSANTATPGDPTISDADGTWSGDLLNRTNHTAIYDPVTERNRMIVFGGYDGEYQNDTWALSLGPSAQWTAVQTSGALPPPRGGHTAIYDSSRDRLIVFGGYDSAGIRGDVWALELAEPAHWTELTTAGSPPSNRQGATSIYDPVGDRMLVFGGGDGAAGYFNETWALTLAGTPTWTQLAPTNDPPAPRSGHVAAYDPVGQRMIICGGRGQSGPWGGLLGDTWALSLSGPLAWSRLTSHFRPGLTNFPAGPMIYDAAGQRLVLFGIYVVESGRAWADVSGLQLTDPIPSEWSVIANPGAAPLASSAVYDSVGDRMVTFGSWSCQNTEVWALSFGGTPTWDRLLPTVSLPTSRGVHTAVYDPIRDRMIIYGGRGCGEAADGSVWALSLSGSPTWSQIASGASGPGPRSSHSAIYDPVRDRMIIFGGMNGPPSTLLDDVWALSLSGTPTWTQLAPGAGSPAARLDHSAIYDPVRDRMLVFGGSDFYNSRSDTWALSLSGTPAWTQLTPGGNAPRRSMHSAIYDCSQDRMLVFGGWSSANQQYLDEVWELSLAGSPAWSQLFPIGTLPRGREGHTVIYDPVRGRMVVYGGYSEYDGQGHRLADCWALDLTGTLRWSVLNPAGPQPSGRMGTPAIYDPLRDRMVVFGGESNGNTLNDMWMLTWGEPPSTPAEPTSFSAALSGCPQHAHITWQDNSCDETGFVIEVEENASGTWTLAAMVAANTTSWDSPTLTYGTDYVYRVRSCNGALCSQWVYSVLERVGPRITRLIPDHVTWGDTGVDIVVEGCGFQQGAGIQIAPPGMSMAASWWNPGQLHVSINLLGPLPGGAVEVVVQNPDGSVSPSKPLRVETLTVPHPSTYAPVFWFAPGEPWLSTSPLFPDAAGNTYYDHPVSRQVAYANLTDVAKRGRTIVYYSIYGDDPATEPAVPFPHVIGGTPCIVYEYWLYFFYDRYTECGSIVWNQHQHDWEKVFVFVQASDHKVRGIAGSAHSLDALYFNPSNVYELQPPIDPGQGGFHPTVLVELGGHATCPDIDGDGRFDRSVDVNGCGAGHAWGIQDDLEQRNPLDRLSPGIGPGTYRLCSLDGLRDVVDPAEGGGFTQTIPVSGTFWDGSREQKCKECRSTPFSRLEGALQTSTTFRGSEPVNPNPSSAFVRALEALCPQPCRSTEPAREIRTGHIPIEHAWQGKQGAYLVEPRKILPWCYCVAFPACPGHIAEATIHGVLQGVCGMAVLARNGGGGAWKSAGEADESPILEYCRVGEDDIVRFSGIAEGVHSLFVDVEGAAPFQQTVQITATDTLLGANGRIVLVPADRYFTLRCQVRDADHDPIGGAQVRFALMPDSLLLPTVTDSLGYAFASVDTSGWYKVSVSVMGFQDRLLDVRGAFGDTVEAVFTTPFDRWDPTETHGVPVTRTRLRQNHPNPFNPITEIEFDLATREHVRVEVLAVNGRRIRTLLSEFLAPGHYRRVWDGLDDQGRSVSSGVYTYRLTAGRFAQTRKLVLVR